MTTIHWIPRRAAGPATLILEVAKRGVIILTLVTSVAVSQESWLDMSTRAKELREKGEPEKAEKLFRAALQEARNSGIDEHRIVFVTHNLAIALIDQDRLAEAAGLLEAAMPILDRSLGPDHVEPALCRLRLGGCYRKFGRYREAETLILAARAPLERSLGANDPLASFLTELGSLYRETGRCPESEKIQLRALAIRQARLGKEHRQTNLSVAQLGMTYHCLGRYSEARQYLQKALVRLEGDRPDRKVAAAWYVLGAAHFALRELDQAETAWKRVLRTLEEFPEDRGITANTLGALGTLKQFRGQDKEAEALLLSAAEIASRPPELREEVAPILNTLGKIYGNRKEWERAESAYTRAAAIVREAAGPWHPTLAGILVSFGRLRIQQKRISEAAELYRQALEIDAKSLGPQHPYYAEHMIEYAVVLRKLNRKAEAQELEAKARAVAEAARSSNALFQHTVDVRDLRSP